MVELPPDPATKEALAMAFTIYDASISPMLKFLENLSKLLDKAVAQAKTEDRDLQALLDARLAPDMFPFTRQIQIVSDTAKGCAARLSGKEPPSWPDEEKTFADLQARIERTISYLKSMRPEEFANAEGREIVLKFPSRTIQMLGGDYVNNFVMPNFHFHMTVAYGLLRANGIAIGKMDYLGGA
jgi:uncharacterized protein